jgi:hypothetical protein
LQTWGFPTAREFSMPVSRNQPVAASRLSSHTANEVPTAATAAPQPRIRETPVDLAPRLARAHAVAFRHAKHPIKRHIADYAKQRLFGPDSKVTTPRLEAGRGLAASMEGDTIPPTHAETEYGNVARAALGLLSVLPPGVTRTCLETPEQLTALQQRANGAEEAPKDDEWVRLLVASTLRYMRSQSPHGQFNESVIAPMAMGRDFMDDTDAAVVRDVSDPTTIRGMQINTAVPMARVGVLIAHETVHEEQLHSKFDAQAKRQSARPNVENLSAQEPSARHPRQHFHAAAALTVSTKPAPPSGNRYATDPVEVLAYLEQATAMQHAHGDSTALSATAAQHREVLVDLLKNIAKNIFEREYQTAIVKEIKGELVIKNEVNYFSSEQNNVDDSSESFLEKQYSAFKKLNGVLSQLSVIERMLESEVGDEICELVNESLAKIKDAEQDDPLLVLDSISAEFAEHIQSMKAKHGARIYIPRGAEKPIYEDAVEASQNSLNIICRTPGQTHQVIPITPEHVQTSLVNSGFSQACSALQKTILSGEEIPHEMIIQPLMLLAGYLFNHPKSKIPPIALNVYSAPAEIPAVAGLTVTPQQRKARLDTGTWQVHLPMHLLSDPEKIPGQLAKLAFDMAQAARSMVGIDAFILRFQEMEAKGIPDPGSQSEAISIQLKAISPDKPQKPAADTAQGLLSSVIGASNEYETDEVGVPNSFHGRDKPSAENHWHNFGERTLLKRMKDDPNETPQNRAYAEQAYHAGAAKRKEAEPLLALRRELGLQANALCSGGAHELR